MEIVASKKLHSFRSSESDRHYSTSAARSLVARAPSIDKKDLDFTFSTEVKRNLNVFPKGIS